MIAQGAKNLIFLSRSGGKNETARVFLDALRQAGANTEAIACDVTNATEVNQSIEATLQRFPPIRGVIQAAMVLEVRFPT